MASRLHRGLTLDELTPPTAIRLSVPPGIDGARRRRHHSRVNRRAVHSAADATNELRRIEPHAPIFLLVWRRGTEALLQMRKD